MSIHSDDVAGAVVAALGAPAGRYNVVDDERLTRRDYRDAIATAFGLPHLRPIPAFLVRVAAGPAADALLASQRVAYTRFKAATGWASVAEARTARGALTR